jgi:hypothetical protein
MNKFAAFISILVLGPLLAAIYGVLHDQLTFTISPEYYTDFKFYQFGLVEDLNSIPSNPRLLVATVGVMATWWVGLFIGVVLACVGLIHKTGKQMFKITIKAFFLTLIIAFVVGLLGLGYGVVSFEPVFNSPWVPQYAIEMSRNYEMVGSMHNFSYLGGLIGLIVAIIYSVKQKL